MILSSDRFTGVLAAALTPLKTNLSPDIKLMAEHCRWLLRNGCDGLAILGTTGEANSFSVKERIRIIEGLLEEKIPGERLLPGTGSCSISDSVLLTKTALKAGARGVLMLPPFYYKNPLDEGLYAYFSEVIQQVSDEKLTIYLYHFPQMSATPFSFSLIERLIKSYPNTVVGMKDSSGDLENMVGAVKNFDNFCVHAGADDLFLKLLEKGGGGCITACANITCSLSAKIFSGYNAGMDVSVPNDKLIKVRKTLSQFKLPSGLKALTARNTNNERWAKVRPPLVQMDAFDSEKMFKLFDKIGYEMPLSQN